MKIIDWKTKREMLNDWNVEWLNAEWDSDDYFKFECNKNAIWLY